MPCNIYAADGLLASLDSSPGGLPRLRPHPLHLWQALLAAWSLKLQGRDHRRPTASACPGVETRCAASDALAAPHGWRAQHRECPRSHNIRGI